MTSPRSRLLILFLAVAVAAAVATAPISGAQEGGANADAMASMAAMMPGPAHAYLASLEGEYDVTVFAYLAPGTPAMESGGTITRELMLGGRVLRDDLRTTIMGMPFVGIGHTGYDNITGKYWSTWFDNVSTGLTVLEGSMDVETGRGVLEGRTPDARVGEMVPMRMEIFTEDGKMISESYLTFPGGEPFLSMKTIVTPRAGSDAAEPTPDKATESQ